MIHNKCYSQSIAENKKFFTLFIFQLLENLYNNQINKIELENEKGKIIYEILQKKVAHFSKILNVLYS